MKKKYLPMDKQEYQEYVSQLNAEERNFIEKFYEDLYAGGVYNDTLLESEDAKREARKNHNSITRDALNNTVDFNGEMPYHDNINTNELNDLLECVADENDWQVCYDRFGYKAAAILIFEQTEKDLQNKNLTVKVILNRFLEKMNALRRLRWRERKAKHGK